MTFWELFIRRTAVCLLVLVAGAALGHGQRPAPIADLQPTVLLISIDGFRADYLDRSVTPTLAGIARRGVRARWMQPVFPTKTFPNHYTIVTGLYPERHGIVGNDFWDPDRKLQFTHSHPQAADRHWWQGEPIWLTAERQGVKAGTLFWPGSDVDIQGRRSTYWLQYEHELPDNLRIQRLLAWLDLPAKDRPRMLTLYFSTVDTAGHLYGPDSPELTAALRSVDATIGRLLAGFKMRGIEKKVNVVVVSDHGMAPTSPEKTIFLEDYLDPTTMRVASWGQLLSAEALNGNNNALLQTLQKVPYLTAYRKCATPASFHYCQNRRISPVLALADEGWNITTRKMFAARANPERGSHGYDNRLVSMRAVFLASGPGLKKNRLIAEFENVHVYVLMCHLLGIAPAEHQGSLEVFRAVLD